MDGYLDKEADVFVGEGEHPFRAKLDRREDSPPPETPHEEPPPSIAPTPLAPPAPIKERAKKTRERAAPAPVVVTPAVAPAASGTISVHVLPWAMVYVDGAKVGQTPIDGRKVTAGLHVIELANDGVKKREKVTIEVRANGHEEIRRDWEK
jgi:serine/threonine-protein kinase